MTPRSGTKAESSPPAPSPSGEEALARADGALADALSALTEAQEAVRVTEERLSRAAEEPPQLPKSATLVGRRDDGVAGDGEAAELAPPEEGEPLEGGERRRRRARKRGARPFIDQPGVCAICQTAFRARSERKLHKSGWSVRDDVGLCPSCQQDGWELPPAE